MLDTLKKPTPDEVEKSLVTVKQDVMALTVTDAASYEFAGECLKSVRDKLDWVDAYWEDDVKTADQLHKSLVKKREAWRNLLLPALPYIDGTMRKWRQEEERKRRELELKAQAEAKRLQEEQALINAEELEKTGRPEEAQAVMEAAAVPPPVVIPSSVPKIAGMSVRTTWKFRITVPAQIRAEYMVPDESTIGTIVRKMGKAAEKVVGGIEVYPEEVSVRRG
jgi:hypothetical protein